MLASSRLHLLCLMPLRLLQHFIVRRRLVFVVIRLDVIFAHWMIFETVPHQQPPQIGMSVKPNSVKIENLPLLKFRATPDRRERWNVNFVGSIPGAKSNHDWPM